MEEEEKDLVLILKVKLVLELVLATLIMVALMEMAVIRTVVGIKRESISVAVSFIHLHSKS